MKDSSATSEICEWKSGLTGFLSTFLKCYKFSRLKISLVTRKIQVKNIFIKLVLWTMTVKNGRSREIFLSFNFCLFIQRSKNVILKNVIAKLTKSLSQICKFTILHGGKPFQP